MADSEGNFGGNGSVNWEVVVHNARPESIVCRPTGKKGGFIQAGIDDVRERGAKFRVTIQLPRAAEDRRKFLEQVRKGSVTGGSVSFVLPVEPRRRRQIVIRWPSGKPGPRRSPKRRAGRRYPRKGAGQRSR